MICDHCPNSNYIKTGIPSCFLPRCDKSTGVLLARAKELSRISERGAEWRMIVQEIRYRNDREIHQAADSDRPHP